MIIDLAPEVEANIQEQARQQNTTAEELVANLVNEKFPQKQRKPIRGIVPEDDWEERFLSAIIDTGVSLSDEAVSSEGLYD